MESIIRPFSVGREGSRSGITYLGFRIEDLRFGEDPPSLGTTARLMVEARESDAFGARR